MSDGYPIRSHICGLQLFGIQGQGVVDAVSFCLKTLHAEGYQRRGE